MNNKIPFHELAARVATTTGISPESAESFVKIFFEILSESLVKGESVRVKGLGSFTVSVVNGEKTVDFILDKDLSESINAPFSIFEPVALNDGVTEDMLSEINHQETTQTTETTVVGDEEPASSPVEIVKEETTEIALESGTVEETTDKKESGTAMTEIKDDDSPSTEAAVAVTEEEIIEENIADDDNTSITPDPIAEIEKVDVTSSCPATGNIELKERVETEIPVETPVQEISRPASIITPLDEEPEEYVDRRYEEPAGKGSFWWGLAVGLIVGLALGACGVYLAIDHIFPTSSQNDVVMGEIVSDEPTEVVSPDSVSVEPRRVIADSVTAPSSDPDGTEVSDGQAKETVSQDVSEPAIRRDTVRRGYLIHDMAKRFYGSKDYWVYIYEENKSKIGNPNNMQPGVVLIIPPAEKYGIVTGDPESHKRAKNKAGEILSKFPR